MHNSNLNKIKIKSSAINLNKEICQCTLQWKIFYGIDLPFLFVHLTLKSDLSFVLQACFKIMSHTNTNQVETF